MSQAASKNLAASVHQRLLNLARARHQEHQLLLTSYAIERFLYRLGQSPWRDRFILKGASLFGMWDGCPRRATWDVDLLGYGNLGAEDVADVFRQVVAMEVEDDGLEFLSDFLETAPIQKGGDYHGLRVKIPVRLGKAKIMMQVDIGSGHVVNPPAIESIFPVLLDMPHPRLRAYQRETVIAEKLQAMLLLGLANSRMKDFFDIWALASYASFEDARTSKDAPANDCAAMRSDFAINPDKQAQWRGFLRRGRPQITPAFDEAVTQISAFLWPLLERLREHQELERHWPAGGPWQTP